MSVYSKTATPKQREVMKKYEEICCFEFMYQDDMDNGEMTFEEAWNANVSWLETVCADVININTYGAFEDSNPQDKTTKGEG